jgi:hypothetical protein
MSNAYKCDNCGDLYDRNKVDSDREMKRKNNSSLWIHFTINTSSYSTEYAIDICDKCMVMAVKKVAEKI